MLRNLISFIPSSSLTTDTNLRKEPKFIVFLSQLLLLFKFCHFCKEDNPIILARRSGTMVTIRTACNNPECSKEYIWASQPTFDGSRIPAGNFLISLSILLAGGSISKVLQITKHMGLSMISRTTFFRHQQVEWRLLSP